MAWDIDTTYIDDWLESLDKKSGESVVAALDYLASEGPNAKRPVVGEVRGSRFKEMKELRSGSSGRTEIRILFAFDPKRSAIMLFAGDKSGEWKKWYKSAIKKADKLYAEHLAKLGGL